MIVKYQTTSDSLTTFIHINKEGTLPCLIAGFSVSDLNIGFVRYYRSPYYSNDISIKFSYIYTYYPQYLDELGVLLNMDMTKVNRTNISNIVANFLYIDMSFEDIIYFLITKESYLGSFNINCIEEYLGNSQLQQGHYVIKTEHNEVYVEEAEPYKLLLSSKMDINMLGGIFYYNASSKSEDIKLFCDLYLEKNLKNDQYKITKRGLYKLEAKVSRLISAIIRISKNEDN